MYEEPQPNISIIVAVAENLAIGLNNQLLWHISDDLRRFKTLTTGHTVVMGRKTYLSLPKRPLPKRRNIVLTHDNQSHLEGCEEAHSIAELLKMVAGEEEVFIIGGGEIYHQMMPLTQTIYATWIHHHFEADTFFPTIDLSHFQLVRQSEAMHDEVSGLTYSYAEYRRRPQATNIPVTLQ